MMEHDRRLWHLALDCLAVCLLAALLALLMLIPAWLKGAPVPFPKPPTPAIEITSGDYTLTWAGAREPMRLTADGSYTWGKDWHGGWTWQSKTRCFSAYERCNGGNSYFSWSATLDCKGDGKTESGYRVEVRRAKKP
jgi:hypothetical protein